MKITDTHVYFYGKGDIFSNWQPANFLDPVLQVDFANTEQAFMAYKAFFFQDDAALTKIKQETSASKVKELGRGIRWYNEKAWQAVRYGYMVWVNYLKYSKNKEYKEFLLNTQDKILVEASPYDRVWGVGLGENDPLILDEKNWNGQNLLGKALMDVRDYYL